LRIDCTIAPNVQNRILRIASAIPATAVPRPRDPFGAFDRVPDVLDLTPVRTHGRTDALGPPPTGLERGPLDLPAGEIDEFHRRLVHRLRIVGPVEAP
jgi:hypothetical protein